VQRKRNCWYAADCFSELKASAYANPKIEFRNSKPGTSNKRAIALTTIKRPYAYA
jgi:hypothetical protein